MRCNHARAMRIATATLLALAACTPTRIGTMVITHPLRVPVVGAPSLAHEDITITTEDQLKLDGWLFPVSAPRGLVVLVHGKDINRQHFVSAANRFHDKGYVVLAYDQRAHGRSEGSVITYGVRPQARHRRRLLDEAARRARSAPGVPRR